MAGAAARREPSALVALVYLLIVAAGSGVLFWTVPAIVEETGQLADNLPDPSASAKENVERESWVGRATDAIPEVVRDRIQESLDNAGMLVGDVAWGLVSKAVSVVSGSFGLILALTAATVLLFGLLKYPARIRAAGRCRELLRNIKGETFPASHGLHTIPTVRIPKLRVKRLD